MDSKGLNYILYSHVVLPYIGKFRVVKFSCDNISCCKIFVVRGYPRKYFNADV